LQVEMPAISIADLNTTVTSESSETIAARVAAAQEIQNERFRSIGAEEHITLNAHAEGQVLEAITVMEDNAKDMLTTAAETAKLSARGYFRTLRTARTLADMDSVREGRIIEHITKKHIAEALSYRRHSFS
jgi:magnesium chelatase family protein